MSASRRRNSCRDSFYKVDAAVEEDDDSSSVSSLSPASRALAIADRNADEEDRANTSEDDGSSDLSLVLGMRSMRESFDLEGFGVREDWRANRMGYIQGRRGRLQNSPCRRLNEPLGLVSSVANEEVLDDSWQVTGRGLKSTPTKSVGQEDNKALASDAVLGDIEDGMEKLSILDVPFKGRKHGPKERVKVTLRSTFVPGGGLDQSGNDIVAGTVSPEAQKTMTEVVSSDVMKTPSVDGFGNDNGWVHSSLLDDSPMNAKLTGAIPLRMEGSGETARLTTESMAIPGSPRHSARVTEESRASWQKTMSGWSVRPHDVPRLLEHEVSIKGREEDCPNIGSSISMAGGGVNDGMDPGLNCFNPLVVGSVSFDGKVMGGLYANNGLSPDSATKVSLESTNLRKAAAGDSSKLESDGGVVDVGNMRFVSETLESDKRLESLPGRRSRESKESMDHDGLECRSEQEFWEDAAVDRESKSTREFDLEGVNDEGERRLTDGDKGNSLFAGEKTSLSAFDDGVITSSKSGKLSELSVMTKSLSVKTLDCTSGPGVLRPSLDCLDSDKRGSESLDSQKAPSARELVRQFKDLERLWAQFSRRGHHSGAAPAGDKGRLVIPEMQTYLKNLRQLSDSFRADRVRNYEANDAVEVMSGPPTDQGKPWMSGPSPSALTVPIGKGSSVSYKMATNGVRSLGQRGGNRQHKKSAGGFVSTSSRVPRSSINAVKARLRGGSSGDGSGGSNRISRAAASRGLKIIQNSPSNLASQPPVLFRPSKTVPSGRGWPATATAASLSRSKQGGRGPLIKRVSTSTKSIPSVRSPTSPRPPRVSLTRTVMGKLRTSVVGKAPGVRGGKAMLTGTRKASIARGDPKSSLERGSKGGSKGALSRKQRLQRKPALAASPVGRPRKPSLFITKPDVSKANSSGLASTSRVPSGKDGPRFFFSPKSSGENSQAKNVSSPTKDLLTHKELDGVSPRSRKKMALKLFGIDDSIPSPPRIGRMLMDATASGKAAEGLP